MTEHKLLPLGTLIKRRSVARRCPAAQRLNVETAGAGERRHLVGPEQLLLRLAAQGYEGCETPMYRDWQGQCGAIRLRSGAQVLDQDSALRTPQSDDGVVVVGH